ncbi:unnamed protein product [Amaranthus hypochondriacus]
MVPSRTNYDFPSHPSTRPTRGSTRSSWSSTRSPSFSGSQSDHRGGRVGSHYGGGGFYQSRGGPPNSRGGSFGGRSRGWWGPSTSRGDDVTNLNPNPIEDVCEKFDELEVVEESKEVGENFGNYNNSNMINFDAYDDIPVEVSGQNVPKCATSFAEIDLGKALNENIKRCKYVKPTPIQCHAIPIALAGRDLMACAQTGSGKTAAFCFPIIAGILKNNSPQRQPLIRDGGGYGSRMFSPAALIMSPTRELASQIHDEAIKFAYQTGVKVGVAYGGTPMGDQLRRLAKGVDILVATPGRLVDMVERGKVSLRTVRYLALDEADRMLDMGFEPQIRKIVQQMNMPQPGSRQTMLFSATFPTEIQRLASDFLSNYIFLAVGKVGSSTDLIKQKVEFVDDFDKRRYLKDILLSEKSSGPNGKHPLTIVFVETKRGADDLANWLSRCGFPATAIHGDKVQWERERALRSFKSGDTPIIVATDVAARGLDIPSVAHVINFDMPRDIDDYVHRIGRTGRAGKSGLATAFYNDKNQPISRALVELMEDNHQEVPSWLTECAETPSYGNGGGRSRRSRGGNFGGRDYRSFDQSSNNYSSTGEYSSAETFAEPISEEVDPYSCPTYGLTHGYESIVATGWD